MVSDDPPRICVHYLTVNISSGEECPSGQAAVLTNYDKCYSKGRKYCCPTPVELTNCHWEGGTSGRDCANAKCNSTELQVAKSALGDSYSTCDCKALHSLLP